MTVQRRRDVRAPKTRFWEIDLARGLAVILMIFFHGMWDLTFLGLSPISVFTREWQFFARGIGSSFTFLLGMSVAVRFTMQGANTSSWLALMARRGLRIFGYGLLVSLATYLVVGDQFVVFGILHMQGVAVIMAACAVLLPVWLSAAIGLLLFVFGMFLNTLMVPYPWFIWLGLTEQGRAMVDYYPLLPWSGFALLGVACGTCIYRRGKPPVLPLLSNLMPVRALCFLGRHSLPIYLIHQPVLLGLLMLWIRLMR